MRTVSEYVFGSTILWFRTQKSLSQRKLSALMGYKSDSVISKYEKGKSNPTYKLISQFADIFNVETHVFVLIMLEFEKIPYDQHERVIKDQKYFATNHRWIASQYKVMLPTVIYQTYPKQ